MWIKPTSDIQSHEITPESIYRQRRQFLKLGAASLFSGALHASLTHAKPFDDLQKMPYKSAQAGSGFFTTEEQTPYGDATRYNNFYEFGAEKTAPEKNSKNFVTQPWTVTVEGEVEKPGEYALEDIYHSDWVEERIYRLRCVEAWSMVIPWLGVPLAKILQQFKPTSKAKYVYFETLYDPEQMPDQASRFAAIEYPYKEGLRIDEAMHPLALVAVGMYGKELPNQNGAPLRLVVPWKYGFKSIKSIVKIRLQENQPKTTWMKSGPREYGFYANVNPAVDHPRWTQKYERRLPSSLFSPNRIPTQLFNGYADQVARLYKGMDLVRHF